MENSSHDVRAHLLNHIILYFLLINSFSSRKRFDTLMWIVVISAAIFSGTGMFYFYVILDNPIKARFGHLSIGSVANVFPELPVNFIGTITVFAILICLHYFFKEHRLYSRAAIIACLLSLFAATILTTSRGTFVALVLAVTIQLLLKNKKIVPFFLLAVAGIVMLTPLKGRMDTSALKERLKINYVTYQVIKDHPIGGIGFGTQTFINNIDKNSYLNSIPKEKRPAEILTPHNLLLDITVRLGLIGLILLLSIIFIFGKMCWETIRHARDDGIRDWVYCTVISFVAYCIIGLAEPVFLFKASAIVFYIILAMITILWRLNQGETTRN
ncbi:O-antigen ligase family protein [Thermodesulfobacteriota bacterium]